MAYLYAFEARAYGLVLGFAALALLSWQSVALGRRRVLSLVCLAGGLSAAVSSHYYGIFVILPLALGEASRSVSRRRVDLASPSGLSPVHSTAARIRRLARRRPCLLDPAG